MRPNRTPPATPIAPVNTETPIVVATLPCSLACIPLRDAFVDRPTDALPFCARGRDRFRLLVAAFGRLEPLLLSRLRVPALVARLPLPLALLVVSEPREALPLELPDPLLRGCLARPRLADARGRLGALDPFDADEERLRLLVPLGVPRSVAAAMVTS